MGGLLNPQYEKAFLIMNPNPEAMNEKIDTLGVHTENQNSCKIKKKTNHHKQSKVSKKWSTHTQLMSQTTGSKRGTLEQ